MKERIMLKIRPYRKDDLEVVARIVCDQWQKFIVCDCTPEGAKYWRNHLEPIKANIKNLAKKYDGDTIAFVATNDEKVVGAAMGTKDELIRLFVRHQHHNRGIGRRLLNRYEQQCHRQESKSIRILASLYAVDFYIKLGCKKTTGVRNLKGMRIQPMKKVL